MGQNPVNAGNLIEIQKMQETLRSGNIYGERNNNSATFDMTDHTILLLRQLFSVVQSVGLLFPLQLYTENLLQW